MVVPVLVTLPLLSTVVEVDELGLAGSVTSVVWPPLASVVEVTVTAVVWLLLSVIVTLVVVVPSFWFTSTSTFGSPFLPPVDPFLSRGAAVGLPAAL